MCRWFGDERAIASPLGGAAQTLLRGAQIAPKTNAKLEYERLSEIERYRLIELLDPKVTHYEFFLSRPPLPKVDWSADNDLLTAIAERNPCMDGFPSQCVFNYDYQIVNLSPQELKFLESCNGLSTVGEILTSSSLGLDGVRRRLLQQLLILLIPS
jgi:hypothetical protein